ncbi:CvpA family protein [Poseidonocella sedimentorum]|uniref:Membrane protein required for colicin V production n=1 Tax=Poseidonocella sedimentorum TaxID=871652 RepID=A0A1I6CUC4_9RHOB|nr:CvpA family protein [Poseidonocella sedimentorum]SFQ96788.1 membrane protein required for colicin V production [Poseidonocella sedimentorum]
MDGFTLIDGAVAVIIVLSALLAYSRGLVREVMAIAGWVVAAVMAFVFADRLQPLVKEIPVLGEYLADSCELGIIAAFAIVFTIALVVVSIFTPLLSSAVQRTALDGVDQGLGFLFGVFRGVLLVAVAFFVYNTLVAANAMPMVDNSRSAAIFDSLIETIEARNPEQALGWVTTQYEQLMGACGEV